MLTYIKKKKLNKANPIIMGKEVCANISKSKHPEVLLIMMDGWRPLQREETPCLEQLLGLKLSPDIKMNALLLLIKMLENCLGHCIPSASIIPST